MDEDKDQPKTSLTKKGSTEEKDAKGPEAARKSVGSTRSTLLKGNDPELTEEVKRAVAEYNNNLFWNMRY